MQNINDLEGLLVHFVQTLYAAEEQIFKAMPSLIEKSHHSSLKNALKHHHGLTEEQKQRLIKILRLIQEKGTGTTHDDQKLAFEPGFVGKGIAGLLDEATEVMSKKLDPDVTDAAIIASIQKLEHYEICTYGSALAFAVQLKYHAVEKLLKESLDEEYEADDLLTALATAALNKEAVKEGEVIAGSQKEPKNDDNENYTEPIVQPSKASISERTINSPGGRAGTSHRGYGNGESRGH